METREESKITIMSFSGIYSREQFKEEEVAWMDVSHIPGTNCYCDGEAFDALLHCISGIPVRGIHFIDSGNYHYMSRIWLEKVTDPVTLMVFDNHTDMQPPAFGGILSCGGWIAAALAELELVREVILVGPDEDAFSQTEPKLRERVKFLSREKLQEGKPEEIEEFLMEAVKNAENTLYLSIDKDILRPGEADTSWSQGDLTLTRLMGMLKTILRSVKNGKKNFAGVDICGESESGGGENHESNVKADRELLNCLRGEIL